MVVVPGAPLAPAGTGVTGSQPEGVNATELVLKVLGAIAAGIGILGFVTLVGGVIVWARAEQAGLPATEAVAVVPRSVLVTTGATFLVPAMLYALAVVLAIAAVHLIVALVARFRAQDLSRKAAQLRKQADQAKVLVEPEQQQAAATRALAVSQREAHYLALGGAASAMPLDELNAQATVQEEQAEQAEASAAEARASAETLEADAQSAEARRELALQSKPGLASPQRIVEYVAALVMLTVLPLVFESPLGELTKLHSLIVAGVALIAAIASVAIYLETQRFLWLGVVAFVSVGVYMGVLTYLRTIERPEVEPVAALRSGQSPLVGFFVAETSEDVYLGTFKSRAGVPPRLLIVPRSQVTDMTIGPLLKVSEAGERARTLVQQICAQSLESPSTAKHVATPACKEREVEALSAS